MSKNYSEQELTNTIKDNMTFIAESVSKSIADVTVSDVKEYFAVNAENQDVDAEALAKDALSSISHYAHEIENSDAQIERILVELKDIVSYDDVLRALEVRLQNENDDLAIAEAFVNEDDQNPARDMTLTQIDQFLRFNATSLAEQRKNFAANKTLF